MSFFSIITMVGFLAFRDNKIDYAVLECGIGARLDPTNVVSRVPCSAVTSIGLDHTEVLGNTIQHIAYEKACIMKAGVQGCVLGLTALPLMEIFQKQADTCGCDVIPVILANS